MRPLERRLLHALSLLVTLTGVVYFWMKYGLTADDPFAVVNHPWQPAMLSLHILASPGLLFIFGLVLQSHVIRQITNNRPPNRKTGYLTLVSFGTMALSGYLLQVVTAPVVRQAVLVTHLVTGALFAVAYLVHLVISVRINRTQRQRAATRRQRASADKRVLAHH